MLKNILFKINLILLTFFLFSCSQSVQNQPSDNSQIKKLKSTNQNFVPLFNGENFEGWEGNLDFFELKMG